MEEQGEDEVKDSEENDEDDSIFEDDDIFEDSLDDGDDPYDMKQFLNGTRFV